jgi:hypothetical protein
MRYQLTDDQIDTLRAAAKAIREGACDQRAAASEDGLDLYRILGDGTAQSVQPSRAPRWLLRLLFTLGQGLERSHWAKFLDSVAWAGAQWHGLDSTAWDRLRLEFQARAIEQALAFATSLQPEPPPRYWRQIEPLAQAVLAALRGEGDIRGATAQIECWSIPEGYDLWDQENATYEAMCAAKGLADAAYSGGDLGEWTESGMAGNVARADGEAMASLSRTVFVLLSEAVSAAKWAKRPYSARKR